VNLAKAGIMLKEVTLFPMSKAFTKEDVESEEDLQNDEDAVLPSGFKNYMTAAGAKRLQEELRRLKHEERPQIVRTVSWAASNGDRSENGDYIYGKRRLREIDRRVRFLTKRLESAVVVDLKRQENDTRASSEVRFGATVTLLGDSTQKKKVRIVGIDESNPAIGDISWISPLSKLLLGQRQGDVVVFRGPRGGEEEFEILTIEYLDDSSFIS